ncbi:MAG: aldo/keto reductase [Oscillospiraceae bacterium]|nr:aldo/keto reductase [Oscillospiraceae bacterium]
MQYRKLGRTGMDVSVIGLGPEHLVGKPYSQVEEVIHASLDRGINIMDLFMPQEEVRRDIGRALGSRRDKMIIQGHIGSAEKDGQFDMTGDLNTAKKNFEDLLRHLGTDYIDLGLLFFLDSEENFTDRFEGMAGYALELKRKGIIRNIGFSSHNPVMAKRVVETGIVDMVMFSINPAFDLFPAGHSVFSMFEDKEYRKDLSGIDPERMDFYRLCEREGVGITVMKAYGGGRLLSAEHTPFSRPLTPGQCIHFSLTRPAVASVLVGAVSEAEIQAACDYLSQTDSERDYSDAVSQYQRDFTGSCVYCGHCQPCPAGIDIAAVTKYLDIAKLDEQNIPPSIRSHYLNLSAHGGDCTGCNSCKERCAFSVDITGNMRKASELFEK